MPKAAFQFNPEQVAHYEVEGWKAYYDRAWLRLLGLIVALTQAQFRIPFPQSLRAAYHIVRASVAWVPQTHDSDKIQQHLRQFYQLARRYSGLVFEVERAAQLELRYWDDHRRLVRQPNKSDFIQTMVALHSEIFAITPKQAQESAELRVEANNVLDTITGKTSDDPARDWRRCEELLTACYRSLQRAVDLKESG
ncbi:MAG: hypothetical protein OHK0023_18660 [Anaerolineae bacterium]